MTFQSLVGKIILAVNSAIPMLATLAMVLFFWGLVNYIYRSGDTKARAKGRELVVWGLVAMFVIMSLWGILRLLCVSFIGNGNCVATWQQ